jgi:hypothetical protein
LVDQYGNEVVDNFDENRVVMKEMFVKNVKGSPSAEERVRQTKLAKSFESLSELGI